MGKKGNRLHQKEATSNGTERGRKHRSERVEEAAWKRGGKAC